MSKNRKHYDPRLVARADVASRAQHGIARHDVKHQEYPPITGIGTEVAYRNSITVFSFWLWDTDRKKLRTATIDDAKEWLRIRSGSVVQKTLDLDRQALANKFRTRLQFVMSEVPTFPVWRPYSAGQIKMLIQGTSANLALSIAICSIAGLRSMELISICRASDHEESTRDWVEGRFAGRESWAVFIVQGKGNLWREVRCPPAIAEELETHRRSAPVRVRNRERDHWSYYNITSGQSFCQAFSRLSKKALGWSHGAHGLRHTFAVSRLFELRQLGLERIKSLKILAGELGHFSISTTQGYLGNNG